MRPILELFRAVNELQTLRLERDATERNTVETAVREVLAHLEAHRRLTTQQIDDALAKTASPFVRERSEEAFAAWEELRREIEELLDGLRTSGDAWRHFWDLIDDLVARRLRGFGVRTVAEPFELMLSPSTLMAAASSDAAASLASLPSQPDAEDLRPLYGEPPVAAKVEELGRDAERIFRFVAEEIAQSHYVGHFRSPAEVLADRVGNDSDLSGLLVEMLRVAGAPARLAFGNVRESLRDLGKRIDIRSPPELMRFLADSGRQVFSQTIDGEPLVDIWERVWVQAWIGGRWIDLDPTERDLEIEFGTGLSSLVRWSPIGETTSDEPSLESAYFENAQAIAGPLPFFEQHVHDTLVLAGVPASEPLESAFRKRRVVSVASFPPPLRGVRLFPPTGTRTFDERAAWTATLQLTAVGIGSVLDVTRSLPLRNRASWSLTWHPATEVAEAFRTSGYGPGGVPSFAMELRPRLEIRSADGTVETIDGIAHATAGTIVHAQIVLHSPATSRSRRSEARINAGASWALRIEPPGADLVDLPVPDRLPRANGSDRAELLPPLLEIYHRRLAQVARRVASLSDAVALTGPWASLIGAHLEPLTVARQIAALRSSSWLLDVKVIDYALYASGSSAATRGAEELFLAQGSWQEAALFRDLLHRKASSTIEALRQAVAEKIPLVTIGRDDEAAFERLQMPENVLTALRWALADRHRTVTIPARPILFGGRETVAWIARRDDKPPSEYAIAGLWGGKTDDDYKVVILYRTPVGVLVDIGESEECAALAYDDEGNDLTGSIRWTSEPSIGSGNGGTATFHPERVGASLVIAQVGSSGLQSGEIAADATGLFTPFVAILEIRAENPAVELSRVDKNERGRPQINKLVGNLYPPGDAIPLGLWCGQSVDLQLTLLVAAAGRKTFKLRIKAEDPGSRVRVAEKTVSVSEGEPTVDVRLEANNTMGVVTSLVWSFAIESGSFKPERDQPMELEIFISRDEPIRHRGHVEEHVYRWACTFVDGMGKGASDEDVLGSMLARRADTDLVYGALPRGMPTVEGAYELIAHGFAMCAEFADLFIALARIHCIQGKRYKLMLGKLPSPDGEVRWGRWLCLSPGVNHRGFNAGDTPGMDREVVVKGRYRTRSTEGDDVLEFKAFGPPLSNLQFWNFNRHYLAGFGNVLYDASFERGSGPDTVTVPGLGAGVMTIPPKSELRPYFQAIMPILVGVVWVKVISPTGRALLDMHVWHDDTVAAGEDLVVLWTLE